MEKIARTCIKNTKRINKKISEAKANNIDISDIIILEYYISSLNGILDPDNLNEPISLETFVLNYKTKESLIEHCSSIYDNPYEAIKHLYNLSKKTLISLRNRIVYNK